MTDGYHGTSVSKVASDVGIRPSAVHWYFASKSDLFAASLRSVVEEGIAAVEQSEWTKPEDQVVLFLTNRKPYRLLHFDSHDLLAESPEVLRIHDELHAWLDSRLMAAVQERLPEATDLDLARDVGHIMFEGLLSTNKESYPIDEVVRFVINALVGAASG